MIAIDVMGGDRAPGVVLQGAVRAARLVPVILVGPEKDTRALLEQIDPNWQNYKITLCNSSQIIGMGEDPVAAVKNKAESSLVKAVACVKEGQAVAALSAGNSGALMIAATFILGRESEFERPAIAGFFPSLSHKKTLVLDLGANTDCRAAHLYQFAHLGCLHLASTMKIDMPTVGLLSNGTEENKGSRLAKESFDVLKQSNLNFVGNVEPFDVFQGRVDVAVCDGFSGNVFLKTMEATFELFSHLMVRQIGKDEETTQEKKSLRMWGENFLSDVSSELGHKKYGGALLLGVKGNVIVCHGNSDAQTIENAILFAWDSFK